MSDQERPSVVVTGSAGLLGQSVCNRLANAGYRVFGLDIMELPESTKLHSNMHDIRCDMTDDQSVQDALNKVRDATDGKLASVAHLAAYYDFSGEESDKYRTVTIEGTDRVLAALKSFEIGQFVFTSTMLVHQPCKVGDRISEDD